MRTNPEVLTRRLDEGAILVHLESNRIFELNETAIRIWESLVEGLEAPAIVARLVSEFEVSRTHAERETAQVLARFQAEGMLLP